MGAPSRRMLPEIAVNTSQKDEETNGFKISNRFVFKGEEEKVSTKESPKHQGVKKFCSIFMIGRETFSSFKNQEK